MHLHPRRHHDGALCSPAENPVCPHEHVYPRHRKDGPADPWPASEFYYGRHRAAYSDRFRIVTSDPNRLTR